MSPHTHGAAWVTLPPSGHTGFNTHVSSSTVPEIKRMLKLFVDLNLKRIGAKMLHPAVRPARRP